jgi:hypothetical protein
VHSDCFALFKDVCRSKDALGRLWMASVSRRPWRGAPNLELDHDTHLAVDLVYQKAERCGIPELAFLPPELIRLIRDYSESARFWRYISAVSLSKELLASCSEADSVSTPLCNISAWARGRDPTISQSSENSPLMRLTFDRRGIKQVERMSSRPSYQHQRSDNLAFAIQEESQMERITAHVKVILFKSYDV